MSVSVMTPRLAAYLSLVRCSEEQRFSNLELDSVIRKYGFEGADRAFLTQLFYGVIERSYTLDHVLRKFSTVPPEKMEPKVLTLLRLGLYQILYLSRVPDSAAVNETVEIAKRETHRGTEGFINAILRRAVREKERLPLPEKGDPAYLSVTYSVSPGICDLLSSQYGAEKTEAMLAAFSRPAPLSLRVNTLKTTPGDVLRLLDAGGFSPEPSGLVPEAILLPLGAVSELPGLADGLFFVQDVASQLCARALGARPGEQILDVCACPGGKSFSAAIGMENRGKVLSLDLHERKLPLVRSGAARLGITILETGVQNGTVRNEAFVSGFDRVLCDVPCSGLGVLAKKPDLRHKSPSDFAHLPAVQSSILRTSADYVKEGGTLVYSTCTLNRAENEGVVEAFLAADPAFSLCADGMPKGTGMCTLFPDEDGTDGFFLAKMVKKPTV